MSRCTGLSFFVLFLMIGACSDDDRRPGDSGTVDTSADGASDTSSDAPWNPDAACAIATAEAEVGNRPVDVIWMVDNSSSMEPATREVQSGLNDFAARIAASGLNYRVIMLSLKGSSPAGDLFPVCIPPPLSGDSSCGDGEFFNHVDVEIRSTQLIEQFLGTLAQTDGFSMGESRGSDPWRDLLRDDSTKTLVFATDDNQRTCSRPCPGCMCQGGDPALTPTSLEDFPGGGDPFNANEIGPGILSSTYGTLFEGYTFNAIYGWGAEGDADVLCTYPDDSEPSAAGHTYTTLVQRTGGVRAQICDQADSATWDSFFDAVATTVEDTARINCEIPLPPPPDGMTLNPNKVNVLFTASGETVPFRQVPSPDMCGGLSGGWYYDNPAAPTTVILCASSCDQAQRELRDTGSAGISVAFGCDTLLI